MFFSSIRRHTSCALVTGFQTCALPICQRRLVRSSTSELPLGHLPLPTWNGCWIRRQCCEEAQRVPAIRECNQNSVRGNVRWTLDEQIGRESCRERVCQ